MSADPTRTLLSMDLLDDDDHDRLDEWGNRAVLTEPAAEPVSIPVVFAVQVGARAGDRRTGVPGQVLDLSRAGSDHQPHRAPAGG